jgi:hypothetical protein
MLPKVVHSTLPFFVHCKFASYTYNYRLTKMLRSRIIDLEFLLESIKSECFYIDERKHEFKVSDSEFKKIDVEDQTQTLIFLKKIVKLLDVLHISEDINMDKFSEADYGNIKTLYESLFEKEKIKYGEKTNVILDFKLMDLNILLLLIKDESVENSYEVQDFFIPKGSYALTAENEKKIVVTPYDTLVSDDYLKYSNIYYDDILPSYKRAQKLNNEIYNFANNTLLNLLMAYDKSSPKKKELIKVAKEIADWILQEDKDVLSNEIKTLNQLQAVKRERKFNDGEKRSLINIAQDSKSNDACKLAAHILLDNFELADYHFKKLELNDQEAFKDFPIYNFRKKSD